MVTEADARVEAAFPHADFCHAGGCPSVGFCYTVGTELTKWRRDHVDAPTDLELDWLEEHGDCGSRECDCITSAIQRFVQEERALVLEQVADASYTASANKPPRVVRVMRQCAEQVRAGVC